MRKAQKEVYIQPAGPETANSHTSLAYSQMFEHLILNTILISNTILRQPSLHNSAIHQTLDIPKAQHFPTQKAHSITPVYSLYLLASILSHQKNWVKRVF